MAIIYHKITGAVLYSGTPAGMAGQDLTGGDFRPRPDLDLTGVSFAGSNLTDATFAGCSSSAISGAASNAVSFIGATITNADFSYFGFNSTDFTNATGTGVIFTGNTGIANFTTASITSSNFEGLTACSINFTGTDLTDTKVTNPSRCNLTMTAATTLASSTSIDPSGGNYSGVDFSFFTGVASGSGVSTTFTSVDFSNINLSGTSFKNVTTNTCNFTNATMRGCYIGNFSTNTVTGVDFSGSTIEYLPSSATNCNYHAVLFLETYSGTDFTGSGFNSLTIPATSSSLGFTSCNFTNCNFNTGFDQKGVRGIFSINFSGSNLTNANFSTCHDCDFSSCTASSDISFNGDLVNCDLSSVNIPTQEIGNFGNALIQNCDFTGSTLGSVFNAFSCEFSGATIGSHRIGTNSRTGKIDLTGGTFTDIGFGTSSKNASIKVDYSGITVTSAFACRGDYSGTDFSGMTIPTGSSFGNGFGVQKLNGCDFSGVDLSGATFTQLSAVGANFHSANLSGCTIAGLASRPSDWRHAQLENAYMGGMTIPAVPLIRGFKPNSSINAPSWINGWPGWPANASTPVASTIQNSSQCEFWAVRLIAGNSYTITVNTLADTNLYICSLAHVQGLTSEQEPPSAAFYLVTDPSPSPVISSYNPPTTDWYYIGVAGNGATTGAYGITVS